VGASDVTVALVLTGIFGLAIGIWLGLPGRYRQSADDIERVMESGIARRKKTKRVFTPLAWVQRQVSARAPSRDRRHGGRARTGFKLESPEERDP